MSGEIKTGFDESDLLDDYNALQYIIRSEIDNRVNTAELVKVLKNNQDGTIDVIPIIRNIDNTNVPIEETAIFGVHYLRLQVGASAIKLEPQEGDVGLLIVNKKDTSGIDINVVKTTRKFNLCDGVYIGGLYGSNTTPTQYIDFSNNGITITSTSAITVNAPTVNLGGTGGVGVATVGKKVTTDGTSGGTIVGYIAEGSTKVKSL